MEPKPPSICRAATSWPGMLRQAGIEHAGDVRMRGQALGEGHERFAACAAARRCSVRMPRISR